MTHGETDPTQALVPDGPLDDTYHRWDSATQVLTDGLSRSEAPTPTTWFVTLHWRLVNGQAMPVGLSIRSYREPSHAVAADGRATFTTGQSNMRGGPREGDQPKPITRELFKHLLVGQMIEQGREQLAAVTTLLSDLAGPGSERAKVAEALASNPVPSGLADERHRRAAQVYAAALDRGDRKPVLTTWRRLNAEGVECTERQVRRWVYVEARRKGYLPARASTTQQVRSQPTITNRKAK